ncbi:MAG: protein kinase [Deltaproteobacteria bacterium]|nr:protein kinase [Deltaproteobacteria bacterium]
MLQPGDLVGERYLIVDLLGEGGMGVVYRAKHAVLGHDVALKALRDDALADDEYRARFLREAQIASRLTSPHVARVYDVGTLASGAPYIVMELLEGNDLDAELAKRACLPVEEAVDLVRQACEAMIDAHAAGIVHRDLKPANLFLARHGSRSIVKVLDFGISRLNAPGEVRLTQTQAAFGTPLYMSPEAILSTKHADERADVWALGVILYELLAGRTPFVGESATAIAVKINVEEPPPLRAFRPDISVGLEAVIGRALAKKLDERWQTARALSDALAPYGGDAPTLSLAPSSVPKLVLEPRPAAASSVPELALAHTEAGTATMPAVPAPAIGSTPEELPPINRNVGPRIGLALALVALGVASGVLLLREAAPEKGAASSSTPMATSSEVGLAAPSVATTMPSAGPGAGAPASEPPPAARQDPDRIGASAERWNPSAVATPSVAPPPTASDPPSLAPVTASPPAVTTTAPAASPLPAAPPPASTTPRSTPNPGGSPLGI